MIYDRESKKYVNHVNGKMLIYHIFSHVRTYILLTQHGFMPNLCITSHIIAQHFEDKKQMDVTYIDLSKAFDKIDHNLLLKILCFFGFNDPALTSASQIHFS